jgi:predicted RNA binding protein YcfA (HicA-like mRNA interferase family)
MKYRELAKRLKKLGCLEERQASGSHTVWVNSMTGQKAIIPDWGSKDLKPGTVRGILRQLGIDRKEFGPIK